MFYAQHAQYHADETIFMICITINSWLCVFSPLLADCQLASAACDGVAAAAAVVAAAAAAAAAAVVAAAAAEKLEAPCCVLSLSSLHSFPERKNKFKFKKESS